MKNNKGFSTIMITGMAVFISVFAMVLLIVLRGAIGGPKDENAAMEAENKAEAIHKEFSEMVNLCDIGVYWDSFNRAMVAISSSKVSVLWLERGNVYKTAFSLEGEYNSIEEKIDAAKKQVEEMFSAETKPGQTTVAVGVKTIYVDTTQDAEAKLIVKVEYQDKSNTKAVWDNTPNPFVQKYQPGVQNIK